MLACLDPTPCASIAFRNSALTSSVLAMSTGILPELVRPPEPGYLGIHLMRAPPPRRAGQDFSTLSGLLTCYHVTSRLLHMPEPQTAIVLGFHVGLRGQQPLYSGAMAIGRRVMQGRPASAPRGPFEARTPINENGSWPSMGSASSLFKGLKAARDKFRRWKPFHQAL